MLTANKCLLLTVIVGISQSSLLGDDRYARFSAVGIELLQPEGFVVAKKWQGLEHETTPSAVLVTTLPAPPSQTTVGFTAERLKTEGMTLHDKTEVTIAGKPGVLLNVSQTQENVELGKWIAAFGDKTTTMIVGTYPKQLEAELSSVVKSIVVGARAIEARRRPPGGNGDFKLGTSNKLRLASDGNNTLIYTADGTIPTKSPDAPLLVVAKSMGKPKIADLRKFALQRIAQTAETRISKIESNEMIEIAGASPACETIAVGDDRSSHTPMLVYQRIIGASDRYFVIQGLVGLDRRDEFLAEFQNMANGFRRIAPSGKQAIAADDAARGSDRPSKVDQSLATSRPTRPLTRSDNGDARPPGPFEPHEIPDERPKTLSRSERDPDSPTQSSRRQRNRAGDRPAERPKIVRLPNPKSPLPEFKYSANDTKRSPEIGRQTGEVFEGRSPAGGVLVGLRVVRGTDFGGSVQAVEPIFQVQGRYVSSGLKGKQGDDVSVLLAPAGYAVGGLQTGTGLWMDAVRLVYMPIEGTRLVVTKPEYSEWIGGNGGRTTEMLSDGSLIVGIAGSVKDNLASIELLYVEPDRVSVVAPTNSSKRGEAPPKEMRVWKSVNGSFSVTAKLETFDGTQAKLTTGDGREISVPAEKLSAADRQYLEKVGKSSHLPEKTGEIGSQQSK